MEAKKKAGRRPVVSAAVYKELLANIGLPIHVDDIAKAHGLSYDQVIGAIYNMRRSGAHDIEIVIPGHTFRLRSVKTDPEPEPDPVKQGRRLFEELGITKKGEIVAQDQDGVLYRVEEL